MCVDWFASESSGRSDLDRKRGRILSLPSCCSAWVKSRRRRRCISFRQAKVVQVAFARDMLEVSRTADNEMSSTRLSFLMHAQWSSPRVALRCSVRTTFLKHSGCAVVATRIGGRLQTLWCSHSGTRLRYSRGLLVADAPIAGGSLEWSALSIRNTKARLGVSTYSFHEAPRGHLHHDIFGLMHSTKSMWPAIRGVSPHRIPLHVF